jgi:hypothetical protein
MKVNIYLFSVSVDVLRSEDVFTCLDSNGHSRESGVTCCARVNHTACPKTQVIIAPDFGVDIHNAICL